MLEVFPTKDWHIRCLVATAALGMGVDVPDVELIIHWGSSISVLDYWQEVGRAGRDGRAAEAHMFATPVSVVNKRMTENCFRSFQRQVIVEKTCVRFAVLRCLYRMYAKCRNGNN